MVKGVCERERFVCEVYVSHMVMGVCVRERFVCEGYVSHIMVRDV